jgi:hypothetical protein
MWVYFPGLFLFSSVIYYTFLWHYPERWAKFVAPNDPALIMSKVSLFCTFSPETTGLHSTAPVPVSRSHDSSYVFIQLLSVMGLLPLL